MLQAILHSILSSNLDIIFLSEHYPVNRFSIFFVFHAINDSMSRNKINIHVPNILFIYRALSFPQPICASAQAF
jgi:hypothetical protein